jgi:hypothetical protein
MSEIIEGEIVEVPKPPKKADVRRINAMTSEEAGQRWCPFSSVVFPITQNANLAMAAPPQSHFVVGNRAFLPPSGAQVAPGTACMGSLCAAWRETGESTGTNGEAKQLGYCGLAGTL